MMAWIRVHEKTYKHVSKEAIWRVWADVNHWSSWHPDLDYCTLEADFSVGNHFFLKPKGMGAVKILLTDMQPGFNFTDCTRFLGARMYDTHVLEETPAGLLLKNTVRVVGPLRWLWVFLVARKVAAGIPDEMDALVARARGL